MKFLLPALLIGVPIAEIATFIKVGNIIGLWPTIAAIILTAVIGATLIRHQGMKTFAEAERASREGRMPIDAVVGGAFLLVAALLLLTPGFITDAFGFLLLWPPLRLSLAKWLWSQFSSRANIHVARGQNSHPDHRNFQNSGPVIEGDVISSNVGDDEGREKQTKPEDTDPQSPWKK